MVSDYVLKYCCEDISLIENYKQAVIDDETWHCHHRKETEEGYSQQELIDLGLYWNRPASELIFIKAEEHKSMHTKGRVSPRKGAVLSEETKRKISIGSKGHVAWNKGKPMPEETRKKLSTSLKGKPGPWAGKKLSEETKKKMSEARKGRIVTNETKRKIAESQKRRLLTLKTIKDYGTEN